MRVYIQFFVCVFFFMESSIWETLGSFIISEDMLWGDDMIEGLLGSAVIARPVPWSNNILPQIFSWSHPIAFLQDNMLPTRTRHLPTHVCNDSDVTCSICIDCIALYTVACKLRCNHWFHEQCIHPWAEKEDTCPNCRAAIRA